MTQTVASYIIHIITNKSNPAFTSDRKGVRVGKMAITEALYYIGIGVMMTLCKWLLQKYKITGKRHLR